MAKKKRNEDEAPAGGWMGPSPTYGLKALAVANGVDRKGRWKWKEIKQTKEDRKRRKIWEKAVAKANKKGQWWFPNPFKKKKGKKK
jgi:hypothetical protein